MYYEIEIQRVFFLKKKTTDRLLRRRQAKKLPRFI